MLNSIEKQLVLIPEVLLLSVGQTYRGLCPACGESNGLTVTRTDTGLLYNDYRVHCGIRGFIPSVGSSYTRDKSIKKEFTPHQFKYETEVLAVDQIEWLCEQFYLTPRQIKQAQWVWSEPLQRVIMPLLTQYGLEYGNACRYYPELQYQEPEYPHEFSAKKYDLGVKVINNYFNQATKLYFPFESCVLKHTRIILVEDIISAIRVNDVVNKEQQIAVALLGTSLDHRQLDFLKGRHIVLALDKDAINKAYYHKAKYNLLFKSCDIVELQKDPKNMTNEAIEEVILGRKNTINNNYRQEKL